MTTRREITTADRAVAYARRSDYLAARGIPTAELLRSVASYALTHGGVVDSGARVQLRMLETLAAHREARIDRYRQRAGLLGRAYLAPRYRAPRSARTGR